MIFEVKAIGGYVSNQRLIPLCRVEANSEEEAANKLLLRKEERFYIIADFENSPRVYLDPLDELPLVNDYPSLVAEVRKAEHPLDWEAQTPGGRMKVPMPSIADLHEAGL